MDFFPRGVKLKLAGTTLAASAFSNRGKKPGWALKGFAYLLSPRLHFSAAPSERWTTDERKAGKLIPPQDQLKDQRDKIDRHEKLPWELVCVRVCAVCQG